MNARLLVAVVLLLAVAVGYFSWDSGTVAAPPAGTQRGGPELPTGAEGGRVEDPSGSAVQRAEILDQPPPGSEGKRIRLQTVTAVGVPVAGAKVHFWPPGETGHAERWRLLRAHDRDLEATLHAHGREAITDENGMVEVLAAHDSDACARLGGDYGQLDLYSYGDAGDAPARIVMMGDVTLEVSVVDGDGRPVAGRRVHVDGSILSRMSGMNLFTDAFGPSDAAGKVIVSHLLYRLDVMGEMLDGSLQVYSRRQYDDDRRPLTIARQVVPHGELHGTVKVQLVEPVGGTLRVRVVDADGKPMDVRVSLQEESGKTWMLHPPAPGNISVFAGVPLDRRWRVVAHFDKREHELEVVGPRVSGQRVEVDLPLPVRRWLLTGRAVRGDGSPLAMAEVTLASTAPHSFLDWPVGTRYIMRADEAGRIAFSSWLPASVHQLDGATFDMWINGIASPTIRVEKTLTQDDCELGDLVHSQIGADRLLAVIEPSCEGEPLKDVWVEVSQMRPGAEYATAVRSNVKRSGATLEVWGVEPGEGPLLVTCKHFDCLSEKVTVSPGETAQVAMVASASFAIAVDCGSLPLDDVTAVLTSNTDADFGHQEYLDAEQQNFEWAWLPVGSYRLRIEVHGFVVYEQDEVVLRKGGNTWPVDGKRLDLGARMKGVYLVARCSETQGHLDVEATIVDRFSLVLAEDSKLVLDWFPLPDTACDLLVRAWGFVPIRVTLASSDVLVQLQPVTSLRLKQSGSPCDEVRVRLLHDPLVDPVLRAFDEQCPHDAEFEFEKWNDGTFEQDFLPGTKLELTPLRNGFPGKPVEVTITTTSPQLLKL